MTIFCACMIGPNDPDPKCPDCGGSGTPAPCELGAHWKGPDNNCTICGATPEQVNEQAKAAFTHLSEASFASTELREQTGRNFGEPLGLAPDDNPKTAIGRTKPPLHAIPPTALLHLGAAMENGEGKYGLFNWRETPVSATIYYDAALRHFMAWWDGEDVAEDSGVHHLAHVMACCAILLDAHEAGKLNDNRGRFGAFSEVAKRMHAERLAKNNSA